MTPEPQDNMWNNVKYHRIKNGLVNFKAVVWCLSFLGVVFSGIRSDKNVCLLLYWALLPCQKNTMQLHLQCYQVKHIGCSLTGLKGGNPQNLSWDMNCFLPKTMLIRIPSAPFTLWLYRVLAHSLTHNRFQNVTPETNNETKKIWQHFPEPQEREIISPRASKS